MEPSDSLGSPNQSPSLGDGPPPADGSIETLPPDMLRMKQQMSNQCFEMAVHLSAENSKRSSSIPEYTMSDNISELEKVKMLHFNSTLALHRAQMWSALGEKMKQSDAEAASLKDLSDRCMALCSHIKQVQQETRQLQDEVTEIQKNRLEMKRFIHEKMKEMEDLMSGKEQPDTEEYKAAVEKAQADLEVYKKMTAMTQNVLRGILLACKVNWLDDPKLRDVVMTLENSPIYE